MLRLHRSARSRGALTRACIEALEPRRLLTALTIAQENALPGSPFSQWNVSGSGDATLQGFTTDISVNEGQTVSFKITDTASAPYHINIYRMGYYQGLGARLVTTISSAQTLDQVQPSPIIDPTTGLVDCGNWSVSASWAVPSDATSGIYFANLIRDDTGGSSQVFFVVRNDASHSDLLFKTSDATWEAYNQWGNGNSLYSGNSIAGTQGTSGASSDTPSNRAVEVSYNRPLGNRGQPPGGGNNSQPLYAEYPMVRWLESNGYDVTYFTDVDTDRFGSLIQNHRIFMSVGHDEYWSGNERANVESARDAGVNLAFLSGNAVYWKTRFASSTSNTDGTTTADRVLACYKETWANSVIDPADPTTWTGTWRDPRFSPPGDGGRPENALTGNISVVDQAPTQFGTAITVPGTDAALRFWRNTSVASLLPDQSINLGQSVLGYEWDVDADNGFRPAGLMDLSSTTQTVPQLLLDYGSSVSSGTATHSLALYRAASGALVFSAGTVQWSWGLDSAHDGATTTPDINIEQATVNLFADMGAQPTTLQSGLVPATASTDHIAPTSAITAPAGGSQLVSGNSVTIQGSATDAGGGVVAGVEVSTDGGATWHPAALAGSSWSYQWIPGATGTIHLMSRAVDDSGNLEAPSAGASVTVNPPTVALSLFSNTAVPANVDSADGTALELGFRFTSDVSGFITGVRFYKASTNTGVHIGTVWSASGVRLATVTFTNETASGWQEANFSTPLAVTAGTQYIVSYHTNVGHYSDTIGAFAGTGINNGPLHGLEDTAAGRDGLFAASANSVFPTTPSLNSANYWVDVVFSTTTSDTTPPSVISETPAPNATGVAITGALTAVFSESIQPASVSFVLKDSSNNVVTATQTYDDSTHTDTLTPSGTLKSSTVYTATVSGALDLVGNAMTAPVAWSFTTGAPVIGSLSFWPNTTTPAVADAADSGAVELGVKFRSDIDGFITGIRFYKGPTNIGIHVGNLWTTTGSNLGSATFTGETASGWQQVNFASAIRITAGTVYIASYHTNVGQYSYNSAYFATAGVDNAPIHALANGVSGGDGVYLYSAASAFPSSTFNSNNYWVDIVFSNSVVDTTPPTVQSTAPAANATNVSISGPLTATFSESVKPATISFVLKDSANAVVPSTLTYDDSTHTATLTPNAPLTSSATYTATVSGAADLANNVMTAPVSWSFTTAAAFGGTYSFWTDTTTPAVADAGDSAAVELGVKFRADVAGFVTGIRFYKGPANTGTHIGNLWSSTGQLLATATFTNETASGWQQVSFNTPVQLVAGTTYAASYHTNVGQYAYTSAYFASTGTDNGPIHALANGVSGGNGIYNYAAASSFPASSFNSTNYWVDILFSVTPAAPGVSSETPAPNATAVDPNTLVIATFNTSVQAATISFVLKDPNGNTIPATVSYSDVSHTATLTPSSRLNPQTVYTATVSGAMDQSGNAMTAPVVWSFTTASNQFLQTTAADFGAGTQSSTAVTNSAGGEVALAQSSDDFLGTALGAGWTTTSWASAGGGPTSVTVANSILSITGAEVRSAAVTAGTPIEAMMAFGAASYQHFGLATDYGAVAGQYWAMFSTLGTSDTLFARVNVNGATQDINIGALPSGMHVYRVQPISGAFQFIVDGVLKTTVTATIPGTIGLRAAFSVFGAAAAMQVDSVRFGAYASSGTFTSSVYDAGQTANWTIATWTATVPAGTTITVQVRSGNTATPDASWSAFQTVTNGGTVPSPAGRYLQYSVTFTTTDPALTPILSDIVIRWT